MEERLSPEKKGTPTRTNGGLRIKQEPGDEMKVGQFCLFWFSLCQ